MNSEHVELDSDENTTNLDSEGGDSYRFISEGWKQNGGGVFHLDKLKSGVSRWIQLQTFPASRVTSASPARARERERKTDPPLMQGWSMRNYSLWFWVDCEDMGTIKVHCRGCLISPRSAESLAYALWPVINVNLCSLESAVHFHFQADQLYLVGLKSTSLPVHSTLKVRLKDPACISPRTAARLRTALERTGDEAAAAHNSVLMVHASVPVRGDIVSLSHTPEI